MTLSSTPTVSIGLPVYNGEKYLEGALKSILNQEFEDFELIVSDNASVDRTPDILRDWAARDSRISLHRNSENLGGAANFNRVLELARGRYFRWAGHDDLLDPAMIGYCVKALEAAGQTYVLVYPQTIIIDSEGRRIEVFDNRLDLQHADPVDRLRHFVRNVRLANPIFGLMRTEVIQSVKGLPGYHSGDLVMLLGLALRGRFLELPEPLFYRRMHRDRSSTAARSPEGFARWFDPAKQHIVVFPRWRLWREMLLEILRSPLSRQDKARAALAVVYEWPRHHWRRLLRDIVRTPRAVARALFRR